MICPKYHSTAVPIDHLASGSALQLTAANDDALERVIINNDYYTLRQIIDQ
jgi:hypothetical protein